MPGRPSGADSRDAARSPSPGRDSGRHAEKGFENTEAASPISVAPFENKILRDLSYFDLSCDRGFFSRTDVEVYDVVVCAGNRVQ